MDDSIPASNGQPSAPGISIRNGPVGEPMDVDHSNGIAKRKSRGSIGNQKSYKDESDSDDAAPLVSAIMRTCFCKIYALSRKRNSLGLVLN